MNRFNKVEAVSFLLSEKLNSFEGKPIKSKIMKKLITCVLFSIILFLGCSLSNKEKLIKEYEETFDGKTKIDLSFKVKDTQFIGTITGKDSLDYFVKIFKERFSDSPKTPEEILKQINIELPKCEKSLNDINKDIDKYKNSGDDYQTLQNWLDRNEPTVLFMRKAHYGIEKYISIQEKIIGNKWQCTFTIKNPILNNAKQEITNQYIFNDDNSKIITRVD